MGISLWEMSKIWLVITTVSKCADVSTMANPIPPIPCTYLEKSKDSLFFAAHVKPNGTVILSSTRHKGSVIILSEEDVQFIATRDFLYRVADSFMDDSKPEKYCLPILFDEDNVDVGGKFLQVSDLSFSSYSFY